MGIRGETVLAALPLYLRKSCAFPKRLDQIWRLCRRLEASLHVRLVRLAVKHSFTVNRAASRKNCKNRGTNKQIPALREPLLSFHKLLVRIDLDAYGCRQIQGETVFYIDVPGLKPQEL